MKRRKIVIDASLQNELIQEVEQLPPPLQRKVIIYAHSLKKYVPKGTAGKDLREFAGILSPEEAEAMLKVIEEGCERIDPNGW
jgi:hypothetical protein